MSKGDKRAREHGGAARSGTPEAQAGLSRAAAGLEDELRQFDRLTALAAKTELDSHKNIDLATQTVDQAAQSHARFAEHLRGLIDAVQIARDRQAASAAALNARSEEIRRRREQFEALRERFGALGEQAREINALVQHALEARRGAESPAERDELLGRMGVAIERMAAVVEDARAIVEDARAQEMRDIERQADALRQQLHASRNKLELVRRALSERGSSS